MRHLKLKPKRLSLKRAAKRASPLAVAQEVNQAADPTRDLRPFSHAPIPVITCVSKRNLFSREAIKVTLSRQEDSVLENGNKGTKASSQDGDRRVEHDVDFAEERFGEFADIYAANRADAAAMRGSRSDARHWLDVESEVVEEREDLED